MQLKEPLFLETQFLNTKVKDKKAPAISVRINLRVDDVIYVTNNKSRMEVVAYEASDSGLFVSDVQGVDGPNVYHLFRHEAIRKASDDLDRFLKHLRGLSEEDYTKIGYRPIAELTNMLNKALVDRQEFYTDLQRQVNVITSRKMPRINEYLVYQDDEVVQYPVTLRAPYNNPMYTQITEEEYQLVDAFLDTFMDEYNKTVLSWYLGAALCNLDIHDDRISKLAIISSSKGGSGKSTLMNALSEALFTNHYREVKDEFDSFFYSSSRFGVSSLSTKRMSLYSEAKFSDDSRRKQDEDERHDFTGMNVSVIKSLITEGYVSSEAKYGDRAMDQLNGFHMVLTNHPPIIKQEDEALNRRLLAIMIHPSPMSEKARTLDLWGQKKFLNYVLEHRQAFANYFVTLFKKNEYQFSHTEYDHADYTLDISDSQRLLDDATSTKVKSLHASIEHGIIRVLETFDRQEHVDTGMLRKDILDVLNGGGSEELRTHIRVESAEGKLYLNASKNFLMRYGSYSPDLRKRLVELYGTPIRKYQQRMIAIPTYKPKS